MKICSCCVKIKLMHNTQFIKADFALTGRKACFWLVCRAMFRKCNQERFELTYVVRSLLCWVPVADRWKKLLVIKCFLITWVQRIKALFLEEEAWENFSVWSFALGIFCAAWICFISDCCSSPTLAGAVLSSGKVALLVIFCSRLDCYWHCCENNTWKGMKKLRVFSKIKSSCFCLQTIKAS